MAETMATQVLVIGGGPGGYVAAIRAAQLGRRATIVEKEHLGGTCLNVGCIPSKCLLEDSKRYHELKDAAARGIELDGVRLNWPAMQARKTQVTDQLVKGVKHLLKGNGVAMLDGAASFVDAHTVEVKGADGATTVTAEHIIIATGSVPMAIPPIAVDHERVWDSTDALGAPEIPTSLGVIGGGYIGMEMACVYHRLGAKVHVMEMLPGILPGFDAELRKEATRVFKKQGIKLYTGQPLALAEATADGYRLHTAADNGEGEVIEVSRVLVAVGRRPYTEGLNLEAAGLAVNDHGFIPADANLRTAQPHIYAIGDVIGGMMLAHKASHEGVFAAELIVGLKAQVKRHIPGVVFTSPQLASVGLTEEEALDQGHEVKVGVFPFRPSGYAKALGELDGLVKWVADVGSSKLLGCHIIGPHAGELIHEATLALELGAGAADLQHMVHAHPTLSEVLREAALALDKRAIHGLN